MRNVDMQVEEGVLVIRIRLDDPGVKSASGKSTVVASTNGNVPVTGTDIRIGVNAWRPVPR